MKVERLKIKMSYVPKENQTNQPSLQKTKLKSAILDMQSVKTLPLF